MRHSRRASREANTLISQVGCHRDICPTAVSDVRDTLWRQRWRATRNGRHDSERNVAAERKGGSAHPSISSGTFVTSQLMYMYTHVMYPLAIKTICQFMWINTRMVSFKIELLKNVTDIVVNHLKWKPACANCSIHCKLSRGVIYCFLYLRQVFFVRFVCQLSWWKTHTGHVVWLVSCDVP